MATLLLDTASDVLVVGLADGTHLAGAVEDRTRRAQAVLELVDELLGQTGHERSAIDRIAVGVGPGGFTGLRVGIATARGLASALAVPLAGVSSLGAMAAPLLADGASSVWASLDARRGERFMQRFELTEDGLLTAVTQLTTVATADVASLLRSVPAAAVEDNHPSGRGLAIVAASASFGAPGLVLPVYGRAPDATPPRDLARAGT